MLKCFPINRHFRAHYTHIPRSTFAWLFVSHLFSVFHLKRVFFWALFDRQMIMEYKNKTSKKKKNKSKSVKTEGRMKNQDAWPPLSLTIYLNTIKDRNGKGLTEAQEMKKRWKEYTEELAEGTLITQITTMLSSLSQSQTFWSVRSSGP